MLFRSPSAFVQHDGFLMIDEIQRVPELLLAIKRAAARSLSPIRWEGSGMTANPGLLHAAQQCESERSHRSGRDPDPIVWVFSSNRNTKNRGFKGIRTPDLLHAMQHGFVSQRRARSGYRRSEPLPRLRASRSVRHYLRPLALGLVVAYRIFYSRKVQPWQSGSPTA